MALSRRLAVAWLAFAAIVLARESGHAQDNYPSRTVKITVGTGPGGATDVTARAAAKLLSDVLGQTFVVENKPGAQGYVALSQFVKEKPDGYNLFLLASSQSVLPAFYELSYDPIGDIAPIARLTRASTILVVNPSLPVKTVGEFVDWAKKNPGKVSFGYQGGPPQLACAMLAKVAGFEALPVPYNASARVVTELLAGRLTYTVMTAEQAKPQIDAGKLRPLATAGKERALAYPDLPTLEQAGFPAYGEGWFGLVGPKGLPKPILDKLHGVFRDRYFGKEPEQALIKAGLEPAGEGPDTFAALLKEEITRWQKTAAELGIKKEKP